MRVGFSMSGSFYRAKRRSACHNKDFQQPYRLRSLEEAFASPDVDTEIPSHIRKGARIRELAKLLVTGRNRAGQFCSHSGSISISRSPFLTAFMRTAWSFSLWSA